MFASPEPDEPFLLQVYLPFVVDVAPAAMPPSAQTMSTLVTTQLSAEYLISPEVQGAEGDVG